MHKVLRAILLVAGMCLSPVALLGQQSPASGAATGKVPVTLDVVVTQGKDGKPVSGLPESAFSVLDRNEPRPIERFRALNESTDPVKVLIVVDAVNIDFTRLAYERDEISRFLQRNDGRLTQPTGLAIVTDTSTSLEPGFSTDGHQISAEFDKQTIGLRDLRRSAGFYGAAERLQISLNALHQLLTRAETEPGRKFLVWMTPGWPLLSGPPVDFSTKDQQQIFQQVVAISDLLRRSRTTLYTVDPLGTAEPLERRFYFEEYLKGVQKPSQAYPADLGAQVLSVQSGGLFLDGSNDLDSLLQRCFDDASAMYELSFLPAPAEQPNEYHKVEVRVNEPKLVARTRQGYYAQP